MSKGALGLLFLAAFVFSGCDPVKEEFRVPAQDYAGLLELNGEKPGILYGRVMLPSAYTQRSIAFTLGDRGFYTQPDGRFRVNRIPPGEYPLKVAIRGYEPLQQQVTIPEDQAVGLGLLRLQFSRGTVMGRLIKENDNSAFAVTVELAPLGDRRQTDQDGFFQFVGVGAGPHALIISDPEFFTHDRKFELQPDQTLNMGNILVFRRALPTMRRVSTRPLE